MTRRAVSAHWLLLASGALLTVGCHPTVPDFERWAQPRPGFSVVSDLAVFDGQLVAAVNAFPLGESGAAIVASRDGHGFEPWLELPDSQGIVQLRVARGKLFAPDADPPGDQTGRVWQLGPAGQGGPVSATVPGVAHTFDVVELGALLVAAGAGTDLRGTLHQSEDGLEWTRAADIPAQRLRLLAVFAGRIFASKTPGGARSDYLSWRPGEAPVPIDAVPGEAHTWSWHVSSSGRLFWSSFTVEQGSRVRSTSDGVTWEDVVGLDGAVVWDFADRDGVTFALSERGLFATRDGVSFWQVARAPDAQAFAPIASGRGVSTEASASLVVWQGDLYAGALHEGWLYRVRDEVIAAALAREPAVVR